MSSESDEHRVPRTHRQSSTPDTPRKRRRLASTASSRRQDHKKFRRDDVEEKYNDDYRLLFNDHITQAASRFEVGDSAQHSTEQIGSSVWSNKEQAVFFAALVRLGRSDTRGIASAIGTKSEVETRDFLQSLQDAAIQQGDTKLTLRDIPAAIDIGNECDQQLEEAADALAWYQERFEASQEQERYGDYWLITPRIAGEVEDALNGIARSRSASVPSRPQSRRSGSGIAGSCIECKKRKTRCDRGTPCGKCSRCETACVYLENSHDPEHVKHTSADISRPTSASGPQEHEPDQLDGGPIGACVACKRRKQRCDRGIPCAICVSLGIECEYPRLGGSGFAGACDRCKKRKKRCDRKTPCTNCAHVQADCVYPITPPQIFGPSPALEPKHEIPQDDVEPMNDAEEAQIFQALPEAKLLQPAAMLRLSRNVFMNRCPEFPSPWPHWSEYTSELAAEPSMYRTAFSDFHRLVVSVTKRLVQTTLMQTTSRLRAQHLRLRHSPVPIIKKRDVYAAIDVLGVKRDGKNRWKGVPRRCGLKVHISTITPRGKRHTVVPWDEVERIMSSTTISNESLTTDVDTSAEPEDFKSRAVRSGTPLPMQNLTLSDSEDDIEPDAGEVFVEHFADKEQRSTHHNTFRPRDPTGKYTSIPPEVEMDESVEQLHTLEDFDQEARRQEEQVLWNMLGLRPTANHDTIKINDDLQGTSTERLTTIHEDWQDTVQYQAPWEAYSKPIPTAEFLANQKSLSPMPITQGRQSHSSRSPSDNISDGSSASGARRPRRRSPIAIELRARGTTAYAALRGEDLGGSDRDISSSSSSDEENEEDEIMEEDIPTQSIEADYAMSDHDSWNSGKQSPSG